LGIDKTFVKKQPKEMNTSQKTNQSPSNALQERFELCVAEVTSSKKPHHDAVLYF